MDCEEVSKVLFLFVDNEMEADLLVLFRAHMERCPGCADKIHYTRKLLLVVRERCVRCSAPHALKRRILTSLPHRQTENVGPL